MLNNREITILNSIINSFIETGQPVGSRTLEKNYNIGLSSATIRNVMSDLESMGLLSKTHHSSGRVPSEMAIENYVLRIIENSSKSSDNPRKLVTKLFEAEGAKIEDMMLKAGEILNLMTNYATLTFISNVKDAKIKQVFIKRIDYKNVLFVLMSDQLQVITNVIKDDGIFDTEKFNNFLEENFYNQKISFFIQNLERLYNQEFKQNLDFIKQILKDLENDDNLDDELVLSGFTRLLDELDFLDADETKQLAILMEDNTALKDLLKNDTEDKIHVYIGKGDSVLKNLSIITSNYTLGDSRTASFGIIAPIRMNYESAINAILELDKTLRYLKSPNISCEGENDG